MFSYYCSSEKNAVNEQVHQIMFHSRSIGYCALKRLVKTTASQPQKSLCGGKLPDVTVIAEIKSFDLIPITFTEMSPE